MKISVWKSAIAVIAAMLSLNAVAFTGSGNDKIEFAREYMRFANGGTDINYQYTGYFSGVVAGQSSVQAMDSYKHAICYPEEASVGQLSEIAAKYVIDHPEERAQPLVFLIWVSHFEAFGPLEEDC